MSDVALITIPTYMPKKALEALLALGTLKCMFATATYTPNQDTLDFANDVTNEATGTSYSSPGITVSTPVVNIDTATNTLTLDAVDITTASLSVSCRWGILHVYTGSLATSPVVAYVDFSGGVGGNVTVTQVIWDALGIAAWTVA